MSHPSYGSAGCTAKAAGAAVHRKRDQLPATLRLRRTHRLRQGRHQRLRRARRDDGGESGRKRNQGRGPLRPDIRGRARPSRVRLRLTDARRRRRSPFGADFRRDLRHAHARSRRVLRHGHSRTTSPPTRRTSCGRRFAGHAVVQAVLSLRRAATGWTAIPASRRRRPSACTGATTTGRISTTPTSSRCPTSGSIPGTPRGTWRSTALPLALVDPDFAKDQLVLMLREWYMHPNGQLPAYEWALRRCESAGARLGGVARLQDRQEAHAASATARSWSASFTSCCSTSPGG